MTALHDAIKVALNSGGTLKDANKVYLEFIKGNFIIPIEQGSPEEEPRVLFLQEKEHRFLPAFTEMCYLEQWAQEISDHIQILRLSGVDLLKGLGDNITVCLDISSDSYKEFNPAELERMKSMVLKFFKD